jgi:hypothetical protein
MALAEKLINSIGTNRKASTIGVPEGIKALNQFHLCHCKPIKITLIQIDTLKARLTITCDVVQNTYGINPNAFENAINVNNENIKLKYLRFFPKFSFVKFNTKS